MKRTIIIKFTNKITVMGYWLMVTVLSLSSAAVYAQTDGGEEEVVVAMQQPKRTDVKQTAYPTMQLQGQVIDLATGAPLAGVQLRALGYDRYVAMSEEDGTFTIIVPEFTTALYAYSPAYASQQVPVGPASEPILIKMLSDQFSPMYGTGTEYTAARTAPSR